MRARGRTPDRRDAAIGRIDGSHSGYFSAHERGDRRRALRGDGMLWLILGIVLLIIAIAGGTIIHPILFVVAILALAVFFFGSRGRRTV
jgi:hypothetical protein